MIAVCEQSKSSALSPDREFAVSLSIVEGDPDEE
jgi:hypothetical protein